MGGAPWYSPRRLIHGPFLKKVGFLATRALTSGPVRRTALGRRLYAALYLVGKRLGEAPEQRLFRDRLAPGMTIVDAGANVGFYTEIFSRLVGETGRVYAFEPDAFCSTILRERVGRFPVDNVRIVTSAVGATNGTVTFYTSLRDRAESRTHPFATHVPAETASVPLVSLDAFCAENGIGRIDVVKMDVEGAEVGVLEGMRRIFAENPPGGLFIEFSPAQLRAAGATPDAFWKILAGAGYGAYELGEDGGLVAISDTATFSARYAEGHTNIWAARGRG
jgi:FkbM family methyltransferase